MAELETREKRSTSILDYAWDWSKWLVDDVIATHTVTVPSGVTKVTSTNTNTIVTAWLSGGTDGTDYLINCQIVTSGGRTDSRAFILQVRDDK